MKYSEELLELARAMAKQERETTYKNTGWTTCERINFMEGFCQGYLAGVTYGNHSKA